MDSWFDEDDCGCRSLKEAMVNKSCIQEPHLATIKNKPFISLHFHKKSKIQLESNVQHALLKWKIYVHTVSCCKGHFADDSEFKER